METFTFLYDKFAQDNTYQILSESVELCRRDDKNILVFFSDHSVERCGNNDINIQ